MRLSPLFSAVVAASAILSLANPSRGETPDLFASSPEELFEVGEASVQTAQTEDASATVASDDSSLAPVNEAGDVSVTDEAASETDPSGIPESESLATAPTGLFINNEEEIIINREGLPDTPVIATPPFSNGETVALDGMDAQAPSPQSAMQETPSDPEPTAAIAPELAPLSPSEQSQTLAIANPSVPGLSPSEILTTPPLLEPSTKNLKSAIPILDPEVAKDPQWLAQDPPMPESDAPSETPEEPETRPVTPEESPTPQPPEPAPEPTNQPAPPPQLPPRTQPTPPQPEPQVLVGEVAISGVEGELEDIVYNAISVTPGRTTTRSQLQQDINAIFATGYFSNVRAEPEDTPLGVRVTFVVEPNPILQAVEVRGNQVLPQTVINDIFGDQYGEILNLRDFQEGIKELNEWYQQQGYVLAQVIDTPQVSDDGTVILEVAEGVVEDIEIRFINEEGELVDAEGNPLEGRTKEYIITRELELEPGEVFNRQTIERDLQRVFGLGIFEDVQISLNPGQNPRNVVVVVNLLEKNTGSIAAGAGISSASGLFGTVSVQEQNLLGRNLKLGAQLQVGQRELLYDINFTDPWIAGAPYRTSYTVNLFRRRSISLIFDGGDPEVELDNGDRPRILRFGGGVTFSRPLDNGWRASLGTQYQRVSIRDSDGDIEEKDELGNDLSFSGDGQDDLFTFQLSGVRDLRNDPAQPTAGSLFRISTEQSVPIGLGTILFNRVRSSYNYYVPVNFIRFSEGPQTIALSVQGGTVIGDLPPYEAFSLGGTTTVRGYDEGEVGTGRSFVQATAEYRFPIYSVVGGALFFDAATDLGTGGDVPGDPAEVRNKPGSGFGYGVGVRIQSPIGPIRVDFAFNDEGDNRFHFGLGERF